MSELHMSCCEEQEYLNMNSGELHLEKSWYVKTL